MLREQLFRCSKSEAFIAFSRQIIIISFFVYSIIKGFSNFGKRFKVIITNVNSWASKISHKKFQKKTTRKKLKSVQLKTSRENFNTCNRYDTTLYAYSSPLAGPIFDTQTDKLNARKTSVWKNVLSAVAHYKSCLIVG